MKKILLTGATGFIGRNISESYLAENYEITAPGSSELNLTDADSADDFFKNKEFDAVLHAAVKPGHRNAKDPTNLFSSNIRMFQNLQRHKDKYEKFINFGSGAIYDISKNITDAEEEEIGKNTCQDEHGRCKNRIHKQIENLDNFVDLNLFGVFGKYEDYRIRFISNAVCKTLFDLPVTLRQNRRFSYLFIDDLMPVLEFFIENNVKYKSYNIVPDEKTELLETAEIIKKISGKDIRIKVETEGFGLDYTGSNKRLKEEFPVKFTSINTAAEKLYKYYEQNKNSLNKELFLTDK